MRKVQVTWSDCVTEDGWAALAVSGLNPHVCETLGYLIAETDDCITIAGTIGRSDDKVETNSRICIPRSFVSRIDDIAVTKPKE